MALEADSGAHEKSDGHKSRVCMADFVGERIQLIRPRAQGVHVNGSISFVSSSSGDMSLRGEELSGTAKLKLGP